MIQKLTLTGNSQQSPGSYPRLRRKRSNAWPLHWGNEYSRASCQLIGTIYYYSPRRFHSQTLKLDSYTYHSENSFLTTYNDGANATWRILWNAIPVTTGFLSSASDSREIYREITDSPETLSAHNTPRGLDSYRAAVVRSKLAHVEWERARIRLE